MSHAFQPDDNAIFDKKVLGGSYSGAGDYTTPFKTIAAKEQAEHPVVKGVGAITSKGYYNNGKLAEDAVVLQVVESDKKTPRPVTWAHTYNGGRTIYTSMGVPDVRTPAASITTNPFAGGPSSFTRRTNRSPSGFGTAKPAAGRSPRCRGVESTGTRRP